jgi:hypothetical protein
MAGHLVGHRGHIRDSSGVDPVVIELEQRTNGDRIVQGFIGPAGCKHAIDIGLTDGRRIRDHLSDERVKRAILLRDGRSVYVGENALNQIPVAQQLSRDRGV